MTSPGEEVPGFATTDDLSNAWRPLTGEETIWAKQLLDAASNLIREKWLAQKGSAIDEADPNAKVVAIAVVKNALSGGDYPNQTQFSTMVGDWQESGTLANPGGMLHFDDWHWSILGLRVKPLPRFSFADQDY